MRPRRDVLYSASSPRYSRLLLAPAPAPCDSAGLSATPGVPWQAIRRSQMFANTFFFAKATSVLGMVFLVTMRLSLNCQQVPSTTTTSRSCWMVGSSHRQFLRDTLGDPMVSEQLNSAMVFLVGQSKHLIVRRVIQEEARSVGDVVVFPFVNTYRNLTYKFVYGLKWVNDNCRESVRFVVKIYDEALVNVFLLADYLKNVTGPTAETSVHCLTWKRTPVESFLCIDDVYSTGILAKMAGVGHVQLRQYYDLFPNDTAPTVRSTAMFTHLGTASIAEQCYRLWDEIMQMCASAALKSVVTLRVAMIWTW
ncbi:hypothetical protein HPB52_025142 [Rhipicephalus sanguineus]|uniref:Hexosyltransferase n=1 Tax=Rhipicephalus sanguineus TaxID=34632 RepID=A0A9D4TDF5_RHISA|nr:hypothetical protein HPB52_025142 [Rhipicephalus sanguineus]